MAKTDEELNELETAQRHDEIIASLRMIAARKDEPVSFGKLETLLEKNLTALASIASKTSPEQPDLRPFIKEITAGIKTLTELYTIKPKSFTIVRNPSTLTSKVTPEY